MGAQNLVGQNLGQYRVLELLGAGGMSSVYRAIHPTLQKEIAIKVMSPAVAHVPGATERFLREARTTAALDHPHIVPVFDFGTQQDLLFVVMRLLTGGSLAQRLEQRLPSLGEASTMLSNLASALDYAHSAGVIHRDVKPSNVMFDNQGIAYLVDFGIAKVADATSMLTGTGMTMGTPAFMSPEQWRGEELTPASDQYSLGCTVYAIVTGKAPFEGTTPYALMHKHLNEMPTPPTAFRAEVPEAVTQVIARAMAKDPAGRFPTCTAFAQAMAAAVTGVEGAGRDFSTFRLPVARAASPRPSTDPPPASAPPARGPGRLLGWAVGIVAVLLVLVIALLLGRPADTSADLATRVALVLAQTASAQPTLTLSPSPTQTARAPTLTTAAAIIPDPATVTATRTADADRSPTAAPSSTAARTPAPSPIPTETSTASATPSPTATATWTPSATATVTSSPTPRPTATLRPTNTPTAVPPPTVGPSQTPTIEPLFAAQTLVAGFATQTATRWTATPSRTFTPTPDVTRTVESAIAAILQETLAARPTATSPASATPEPRPTVAADARPLFIEWLENDPGDQFTTFLSLIDAAGLRDTVEALEGVTILAPTNDAVATSLEAHGLTLADLISDPERLRDIVTYHIVPGQYFLRNLTSGPSLPTQAGHNLQFDLTDGLFTVNGVGFSNLDNRTANGVVHVLDGLLLPPQTEPPPAGVAAVLPRTLDWLASDGGFTILVSAVQSAGLAGVLNVEGTTFLAPTDEAFLAAFEELGVVTDEVMNDRELLRRILHHHLISGEYFLRDLTSGPTLRTLAGTEAEFDLTDGAFTVSGVPIIDVDNRTANGVVHVIDGLLLSPAVTRDMRIVTVTPLSNVNLRSLPSLDAPVIGSLGEGSTVRVDARSPDGAWFRLAERVDSGTRSQWVSASVVRVSGAVSGLPIAPR